MSSAVVLHVGPPKTGTTRVQHVLVHNRDSLLAQGVRVIGSQLLLRDAASDVKGVNRLSGEPTPEGSFERLLARVTQHPDKVVMSCERFSLLNAAQARTVSDAFGDRGLEVVLTLRDPVDLLPSRWQEAVKNGQVADWSTFCHSAASSPEFLERMLRTRSTLESWTEALGPDRVHVVTMATSGSQDLLIDRFCEAAGLDPSWLSKREVPANRSVGWQGAEVIRRVNETGALPWRVRNSEVKGFLSEHLRQHSAASPVPTPELHEVARTYGQEVIDRLLEGGHLLVGDVADLSRRRAPEPTQPPSLDTTELLDLAVDALAAYLSRAEQATRELRIERRRSATPPPRRGLLRRTPNR